MPNPLIFNSTKYKILNNFYIIAGIYNFENENKLFINH